MATGPLTWNGGIVSTPQFLNLDIAPVRGIAGGDNQNFVAQVVVDEDHSDDLQITEHPIEGGAVINDHAFKRPAELRVRMGWSNAYVSDLGLTEVKQVYEQILNLQASRQPSEIYTGKRRYQNMLVASLRTHTDSSLEFSFIADITFREIVLVSTSAWGIGAVQYNQGALANPETHTSNIQTGLLQLIPASVPYNHGPDVPADLFAPAPGEEGLVPQVPH